MPEPRIISSIEDRDGVLHASAYAAEGEPRMLATLGCLPSEESLAALEALLGALRGHLEAEQHG